MNYVHLHCDGVIGMDTTSPAPCGRKVSGSHFASATDLRREVKTRGWKSGRRNAAYETSFMRDDERVIALRKYTLPVDLCPEHAGQLKAIRQRADRRIEQQEAEIQNHEKEQ